jgi:hypothetical protein
MERREYAQIAVALIMIIAMGFGRSVNFPDNVHQLYGVPLVWSTHQLITIAGPVDTWAVNVTNMAVDLVIWVVLILITPRLVEILQKREN